MGKRFVVVVAALAAVFLAMVGAIWYATGPEAPAPAPPLQVPGYDPAGVVSAGGLIDLGRSALGGIPTPAYVIVKDEPPPPPPRGSWEEVPIVSARRGIPGLDMEELQPRLSACFASGGGGGGVTEVKDPAPLQDGETPVLVLQLEVSGDTLRIVDAPVETRGNVGDGVIACAQGALRGQSGPAAGLGAGKHRLRFALVP